MLQQLQHQFRLMQQHQQQLRLQQQQQQQRTGSVGVLPVTSRQSSPAAVAGVMTANTTQYGNRYQTSQPSVIKAYPQQQVLIFILNCFQEMYNIIKMNILP